MSREISASQSVHWISATSGSAGAVASADVADSSASVSENEVQPDSTRLTASRLVRTAGRPRCKRMITSL